MRDLALHFSAPHSFGPNPRCAAGALVLLAHAHALVLPGVGGAPTV